MSSYIQPLIESFEANKNDEDAVQMEKYMKRLFTFYGLKSPLRKNLISSFFKQYGYPDYPEQIARECWSLPQRELQYFAMEMLAKKAKKAPVDRIGLYEFLVIEKSWWDSVDFIASNLVGPYFISYPDKMVPVTQSWMNSGNIWLQRSSLLFQLKYKSATDVELMTRYIKKLYGSKEFFINKAIGWILREYSKTDAKWVVDFVESEQKKLAPLSKREALKWLERNSN
ncbi:MAG: DNA alkylation repair protein [Bacteroidales bacterium]|nr:DNA alkylation repair protein [Bacteroidales bacterium]